MDPLLDNALGWLFVVALAITGSGAVLLVVAGLLLRLQAILLRPAEQSGPRAVSSPPARA
jgi:hypothetical protein